MSNRQLSQQVLNPTAAPANGKPSAIPLREQRLEQYRHVAEEGVQNNPFQVGLRMLCGQLCAHAGRSGGPLRSVGITSCHAAEGRTTIALHLAALAAESRKVSYLSANAPRGQVQQAMREALQWAAHHSNGNGRQVKSGVPGAIPTLATATPHASGRPAFDETSNLLQSLFAEFDLVVVDLPPLGVASVLEWAPLLDGVVLVVEAERVRWQTAAREIATLEQAGGQVLGTVINKRRDYIPQWLYHRL